MADYDVVVIGGGPGGYSAALRAAERGATVALIEAEKPGGACVNFACIPTNILLGSATAYLEAKELDVMGVFSVGETFNLGRATARKDALVTKLADGIGAMLRMRKVDIIEGRGSFTSPTTVSVALTDGGIRELSAEAFVIATGSRWEPPSIPGFPADRVLMPDQVQSLTTAPASVLILADGPCAVPFGAEYAVLLAAAGTDVTLVSDTASCFSALDADLVPVAEAGLEALGVRLLRKATVTGADDSGLSLQTPDGTVEVVADAVLAADPRRPFVEGIGLEAAGLVTNGALKVDRSCRTSVSHIFAVGDVAGGAMLTNAADHMGSVAGINATGGETVTRLAAIPRIVHTFPEAAWVGISESQAREAGYEVTTGVADLAFNAKAIAMGAREGAVKVIAERELGEILGVHVVGPGTSEILATAAAAMQAEVQVHDLAAMVQWHPELVESLADAARNAT